MKTSATNKRIREVIIRIRNETVIPRPDFQRRLVWSNKHKLAFLETVLQGFLFPEVYFANGPIDLDSGDGSVLIVDGQQRLTVPSVTIT
jgi:uncharacterized protein with ParB-like and HNH nuclease domain